METWATKLAKITKNAINDKKNVIDAQNNSQHHECMKSIYNTMRKAASNGEHSICIAFVPKFAYVNKKKIYANKMFLVDEGYIKTVTFTRETEEDRLIIPKSKCIGKFANISRIDKDLTNQKLKLKWTTQNGEERFIPYFNENMNEIIHNVCILFISW